jgi:MHS family proline/betaine transporter-like MFS transporter
MHSHTKTLKASAFGNFMEWFDFTLYGFFAVAIGANFFPATDPLLSTMSAYTAFAAGFIARPLGAYFFGRKADRWGRKPVLILTLLLMGLATLLVVVAPAHKEAGALGTAMVVIARLIAGLAAAGETGAAAAIAIEAAPVERRGLWGGLFSGSTYLGVSAGGLLAMLCYGLLGVEVTNDWGWRIGYASGLLIVPVGYWVRRGIHEEQPKVLPSEKTTNAGTARIVLRVAGLTAFGSTVFYVVIVFMPVYAAKQLGITMGSGMAIAMGASVVTSMTSVLGGWLSDIHGRKRVMYAALAIGAAAAWPLFLTLLDAPSAVSMAAFQWTCAAALGFIAGAGLPLMVESFPPAKRATGVGLGYSLGVMVFGAMAPAVNSLALSKGMTLAPLAYLTIGAAVTCLALLMTPETHPPRSKLAHKATA